MKKNFLLIVLIILFGCTESEDNSPQTNDNPVFGELTDIDGNKYVSVKIGNQVWMAENLKVSRFSNGTIIPNLPNNSQWEKTTSPSWSYQNNNELNNALHGKLYNWYVANDSRNCCPDGWRIPDENDFNILINSLGGVSVAGGKLKQSGNSTWLPPNAGATNSTGFSALPSAYRYDFGSFDDFGHGGGYWVKDNSVKWFFMRNDNTKFEKTVSGTKRTGLSIRCIKN
jgi:uncharacterized protein (TIGR02145 family)